MPVTKVIAAAPGHDESHRGRSIAQPSATEIYSATKETRLDPRLGALLAENYWILLTHLFSAAMFTWMMIAVFLRARRSPLTYSYLAFQATFLLWLLAKLAAAATLDPRAKWLILLVQYVGFCGLMPSFFVFAYAYARGRLPPVLMIGLLSAPSALFLAAVVTNPLHHLFFAAWDIYGFSPGVLFYPHRAYEYSLGLLAAGLWVRAYVRAGRRRPVMIWLFAAAIIAPLLSNVAFLVHPRVFPFDVTPLGFALSLSLLSIGVFQNYLLDITPVARRAALLHSPEGLMLFDSLGKPLAWNEGLRAAFRDGRLRTPSAKGPLERFLNRATIAAVRTRGVGALPRLAVGLRRGGPGIEHIVETVHDGHWRMLLVPVRRWGRREATVLRAIDVTSQVRLHRELALRMRDLDLAGGELRRLASIARQAAEVRARNTLARDVHDILGHSLVLVISLLEVARLSTGPSTRAPALESAARILRGCLEDLRSVSRESRGRAGHELPAFLEAAAEDLRRAGVEVDLVVQGRQVRLDAARLDALTRVCQEAITNALRHGRATRIGIALRYHVSGCELYVENNGRGAPTITKGFGLSGIEARLAELGGEARFLSDGESGFLVRAFVPLAGEATAARS